MSLTINDLTLTDEARRFDHFSIPNAVSAEMSCPELTCRAYVDRQPESESSMQSEVPLSGRIRFSVLVGSA